MDEKPFLIIDFLDEKSKNLDQLFQFYHDHFQAGKLRSFAEENQYIQLFKSVINKSLKHVDVDFVRYVAQQAAVPRQLNARFLDSITPMVKTALDQSIGEMIINSLSGHKTLTTITTIQAEPITKPDVVVDPNNPKIITTKTEMLLLEIIQNLFPHEDIQAKDTESYYSILYQNKNNRWLCRYFGDKKQPTIQFIVPMTNVRKIEIQRAGLSFATADHIYLERPEHVIRLMSILGDCLRYCSNDEHFRKH
jgi:hypothetical protein